MAQVSPARRAAFAILIELERGRNHSDDLLRGRPVAALSPLDRNLATALVLGTLRWQIDLDRRIRPLLKHPNAKLDPEVLIVLRLGAFQLLHMDRIPAHAAIDESVELAKHSGHRFASGMVNAVLRKLAGSPVAPAADFRHAWPAWMVERWTAAYGEETACALCQNGQSQPVLTVRLSGSEVEGELASECIALEPGEMLTAARHVVSGEVASTAAFREGRVRIQDEGSQLIAELAPRGNNVLDCCAAPGGKTFILAERNPAAHIIACEANSRRERELRQRLSPLGPRVECRLADSGALEDNSVFDVVLADVPCSGTGTLSRNPEIRHRLQPQDLPLQAARQLAILRSALRAVRPGGSAVYSTCSLEPEENEHVVNAILSESKDGQIVPINSRIEELCAEGILTALGADRLRESITPQGFLRLLPGAMQTDGFFAALLKKTTRESAAVTRP